MRDLFRIIKRGFGWRLGAIAAALLVAGLGGLFK